MSLIDPVDLSHVLLFLIGVVLGVILVSLVGALMGILWRSFKD